MSSLALLKDCKHEQVSFFHDEKSGLVSIIAIHSTAIGPSLGGTRINAYSSLDDALFDVLRLSEAMSYKNSLCGINCGGGKSVIIADRNIKDGREALFRAFGRAVDSLGGRYIAAEDMGTSVSDIEVVAQVTKHVAGSDPSHGGAGDPSPYTAIGVFDGIRACAERVYGSGDLSQRTIAIQGVGHVGYFLAKMLRKAGAHLIISDINQEIAQKVAAELNAELVYPEQILDTDAEILSPCAIGGVITPEIAKVLDCKIIAGAANNQLSSVEAEIVLKDRGIVYAPDFAINAGGVILCADELEPGGFSEARVLERVSRIYTTVGAILDRAAANNQLTGAVALELAKERINRAKSAKN